MTGFENQQPMAAVMALREATAQCHQDLEGVVDIGTALKSQADYVDLLKTFYGFYHPLEKELQHAGTSSLDFEQAYQDRHKCGLLVQDLSSQAQMDAEQIAALPVCTVLPDVSTDPSRWGILYVLEGSTLGGQYISKQLLAQGITPEAGGAFFNSYGSQTPAMWAETKQLLDAALATPEAIQAAVFAARQTFSCLNQWFVANRRQAVA